MCDFETMQRITSFSSGIFNTFSDHAPITFTISIESSHNVTADVNSDNDECVRCPGISVKWSDENKQTILNGIENNLYALDNCIKDTLHNCVEVDECINNFTGILNDIVLPHCNVSVYTPKPTCQGINTKGGKKLQVDKPWFDDNCRQKFKDYRTALNIFNKCKNYENYANLMNAKSVYKKYNIKKKREFDRYEGNNMEYMRKYNPKQFYKVFNKRKSKGSNSDISMQQFMEHFKNLNEVHNQSEDTEGDTDDDLHAAYDELDKPFDLSEVKKAIKKLNSNKSNAEDCLINEMFIHSIDILAPTLCRLFNTIFNSGIFPETWSKGCVVPVFKKGNINDPNNYRGITIISCLGKLFTSVLNSRLLAWDKEYNIITDAQFGFKPGLGTVDAIFVLQSLINRTLKNRKRLYCCFIDYKKAFDLIDRSKLWTKLVKQGISGKMLKIIKSLYDNIKMCIKFDGNLSHHFSSSSGLLQGEVMSPILYSLYVNDFEMSFIKGGCQSIDIQMINLFILMYADDTILIAETPEGLQKILDSLNCYCDEWNLTVNVQKTKIMVFRNGGVIRANESWTFQDESIEIVNQFSYLGVNVNYNGKFNLTQKHIAEQGRKALFAINSTFKLCNFNIETKCAIFDTYINSILSYGAEVWGFHKAPDVEKVHLSYLKKILGVKRSCSNALVYFELGRYPLSVTRKSKIFKYWLKVRSSENCILKACYDEMVKTNYKWIGDIKNELNSLGLLYIFDDTCANDVRNLKIIESRMKDIYAQSVLGNITQSPKGRLYQHLVDHFTLQSYLRKPINPLYKTYISRFRLSSHTLKIEQGRYTNDRRENRKCTLCNLNDIEDEFHFVLKCPFYSLLRKNYVKSYYYKKPSVFKMIQLFSVQNISELCNLGKYLYLATKKRNESLP